jgi:hypothetical protein
VLLNFQLNLYLVSFNWNKYLRLIAVFKMHSRCFGIMGGHGNFAFNLVVKLFIELCFSQFGVINSVNV